MTTNSWSRRTLLIAGGAALAAPPAFAQITDQMMTIGAANAPLHLIEFASLTCPHCAQFHVDNWETLRTRYVDTGRVRFTLQEMMTAPAGVAVGMFQLARCGGASATEYMRRVSILFARQQAIFESGTMVGVRDALIAAGAEWGLTEAQVMQALMDPAGGQRVQRSAEAAAALGVDHTPSFSFNGVINDDHAFLTSEGMVSMLDAQLARL